CCRLSTRPWAANSPQEFVVGNVAAAPMPGEMPIFRSLRNDSEVLGPGPWRVWGRLKKVAMRLSVIFTRFVVLCPVFTGDSRGACLLSPGERRMGFYQWRLRISLAAAEHLPPLVRVRQRHRSLAPPIRLRRALRRLIASAALLPSVRRSRTTGPVALALAALICASPA